MALRRLAQLVVLARLAALLVPDMLLVAAVGLLAELPRAPALALQVVARVAAVAPGARRVADLHHLLVLLVARLALAPALPLLALGDGLLVRDAWRVRGLR